MRVLLRILMILQGLTLSALALGIIILGPQNLYGLASSTLGLDPQVLAPLSLDFVDGSMRFYAVFLFVFGLIVLNVARDFRDNFKLIPVLMIIMILAGSARLWSIYSIGDTAQISLIAALAEILPALLILMVYFISGKEDRY